MHARGATPPHCVQRHGGRAVRPQCGCRSVCRALGGRKPVLIDTICQPLCRCRRHHLSSSLSRHLRRPLLPSHRPSASIATARRGWALGKGFGRRAGGLAGGRASPTHPPTLPHTHTRSRNRDEDGRRQRRRRCICQAFCQAFCHGFAKDLPRLCQCLLPSRCRGVCQAFATAWCQAFAEPLPSLCQSFAKRLPLAKVWQGLAESLSSFTSWCCVSVAVFFHRLSVGVVFAVVHFGRCHVVHFHPHRV